MPRTWWLILCAFALTCGDPEPVGVVIDGEQIRVIDMHLHPGEWDGIPPETQAYLASRFPWPFNLRPRALADRLLSPDGIVDELDDAGIDRGVLLAVYAPRSVGVTPNSLVIADVDERPDRLLGLASLRVDDWRDNSSAELERLENALREPGMIGVKLAHAHMHFRIDAPEYFGIYEVAGRLGKPVYLHTGTSPFPGIALDRAYTDPAYLEPAIKAYPETIFILGHLGYDFVAAEEGALDTCVELAQRYGNVYLEPSALGSESNDPTGEVLDTAYARIKEGGVIDRVIYGSDGPQSPGFVADYLERSVAAMRRADYDVDEVRAVLSDNFLRVFGEAVGR